MNDEIELSVWVLYGGAKAEYFTGRPNDSSTRMLLNDLVKLKLPHPKRDNIDFISGRDGAYGGSFFWPKIPLNGVSSQNC
jgi:hypothetical protein